MYQNPRSGSERSEVRPGRPGRQDSLLLGGRGGWERQPVLAARQGDSGPGSHMVHFVGLPVASGQYLGGSLDCFFLFFIFLSTVCCQA